MTNKSKPSNLTSLDLLDQAVNRMNENKRPVVSTPVIDKTAAPGTMPMISRTRREVIDVSPDVAIKGLEDGDLIADPTATYQVINPDNKQPEQLVGTELTRALQKGYAPDTDKHAEYRGELARVDQIKQEEGSAPWATFGKTAVDEALFGLPKHLMSPEQRERFEIGQDQNPWASGLGTATGLLGSLAATGGLVTAGTKAAGNVAARVAPTLTKGIVKASLEGAGIKKLGANAVKQGAKFATENAIFELPRAITEASLGDPKKAAENMLFNVGMGAAMGGLLGGLSSPLGDIRNAIRNRLGSTPAKVDDGLKNFHEFEDASTGGADIGLSDDFVKKEYPSVDHSAPPDVQAKQYEEVVDALRARTKESFLKHDATHPGDGVPLNEVKFSVSDLPEIPSSANVPHDMGKMETKLEAERKFDEQVARAQKGPPVNRDPSAAPPVDVSVSPSSMIDENPDFVSSEIPTAPKQSFSEWKQQRIEDYESLGRELPSNSQLKKDYAKELDDELVKNSSVNDDVEAKHGTLAEDEGESFHRVDTPPPPTQDQLTMAKDTFKPQYRFEQDIVRYEKEMAPVQRSMANDLKRREKLNAELGALDPIGQNNFANPDLPFSATSSKPFLEPKWPSAREQFIHSPSFKSSRMREGLSDLENNVQKMIDKHQSMGPVDISDVPAPGFKKATGSRKELLEGKEPSDLPMATSKGDKKTKSPASDQEPDYKRRIRERREAALNASKTSNSPVLEEYKQKIQDLPVATRVTPEGKINQVVPVADVADIAHDMGKRSDMIFQALFGFDEYFKGVAKTPDLDRTIMKHVDDLVKHMKQRGFDDVDIRLESDRLAERVEKMRTKFKNDADLINSDLEQHVDQIKQRYQSPSEWKVDPNNFSKEAEFELENIKALAEKIRNKTATTSETEQFQKMMDLRFGAQKFPGTAKLPKEAQDISFRQMGTGGKPMMYEQDMQTKLTGRRMDEELESIAPNQSLETGMPLGEFDDLEAALSGQLQDISSVGPMGTQRVARDPNVVVQQLGINELLKIKGAFDTASKLAEMSADLRKSVSSRIDDETIEQVVQNQKKSEGAERLRRRSSMAARDQEYMNKTGEDPQLLDNMGIAYVDTQIPGAPSQGAESLRNIKKNIPDYATEAIKFSIAPKLYVSNKIKDAVLEAASPAMNNKFIYDATGYQPKSPEEARRILKQWGITPSMNFVALMSGQMHGFVNNDSFVRKAVTTIPQQFHDGSDPDPRQAAVTAGERMINAAQNFESSPVSQKFSDTAPNVTKEFDSHLKKNVSILASKAPKTFHDPVDGDRLPTRAEAETYLKWINVAFDPRSIKKKVTDGTLTRDEIEAMQTMWPEAWNVLIAKTVMGEPPKDPTERYTWALMTGQQRTVKHTQSVIGNVMGWGQEKQGVDKGPNKTRTRNSTIPSQQTLSDRLGQG